MPEERHRSRHTRERALKMISSVNGNLSVFQSLNPDHVTGLPELPGIAGLLYSPSLGKSDCILCRSGQCRHPLLSRE